MDFLGQTWVLSKTVVTIANSDPYETILEGNQKMSKNFGNLFCNVPLFWLTFWKIQNKIKICHQLCNFHFPSVTFYRSCQFLYRSCESRDSRDRSWMISCRNLIIRIFQNVPKMTDFDKNLTKDDHKTKYPPIFL